VNKDVHYYIKLQQAMNRDEDSYQLSHGVFPLYQEPEELKVPASSDRGRNVKF